MKDFLKDIDAEFFSRESREDRELRKVSEAVFDKQTFLALYKLAKKEAFTELKSVISRGKEAVIFRGLKDRKDVAVKIYSIEASDFRNMSKYIIGDPRFKGVKNRRHLVYQWAQKEYANLSRIQDLVDCPQPLAVFNNVLVMEFIGKKGVPAPKLKDVEVRKPRQYMDRILEYIKAMHSKGLVHGDLSEYNVLDAGRPVLIDFSTGVLLEHPLASELLERDVKNILKFFRGWGAEKELNEAIEYVKDGGDDSG